MMASMSMWAMCAFAGLDAVVGVMLLWLAFPRVRTDGLRAVLWMWIGTSMVAAVLIVWLLRVWTWVMA